METEEKSPQLNMDDIKALVEYRLKVARMAPALLDALKVATKALRNYTSILGGCCKVAELDALEALIAEAEQGDPNAQPTSPIVMPGIKGAN